jgi:plasmid stability protein
MTTPAIRNLDDSLIKQLHIRAAEHGCSIEEEALHILQQAINPTKPQKGFASRVHQAVMEISGPADLELPPRSLPRPAPDFSDDAS